MDTSLMNEQHSYSSRYYYAIAGFIITLASLAIISTYPTLSQTYDEPAHFTGGIEWLDRGTYNLDESHPPFARILMGLGPYLDGIRSTGNKNEFDEGNALFHQQNTYVRTLTLTRIGVLPFFVLSCVVLVIWTARLLGKATALATLGFYATLPSILAHAGLATTDLPITAMLLVSYYAWQRWLLQPTLSAAVLVGFVTGLTILTKFSALIFIPLGYGVILAVSGRAILNSKAKLLHSTEHLIQSALLAAAVSFITFWAGYQFSWNSIAAMEALDINRIDYDPWIDYTPPVVISNQFERLAIPAPEFFIGLKELLHKNREGHAPYFLGQRFDLNGKWYFFLVLTAVKTPLPFLILSGLGFFLLLRDSSVQPAYKRVTPLVLIMVVHLVGMVSSINLGLRHLLISFPFAAMLAGFGWVTIWRRNKQRQAVQGLLCLALLWQFSTMLRHHPDFISYFNELAGHQPEFFASDSDLDWGQDFFRLVHKLQDLKINDAAIAYFGTIDPKKHEMPTFRVLKPFEPLSGWLAVSINKLKSDEGYEWLENYQHVALVGTSIRLYYIPQTEEKHFYNYVQESLEAVAAQKHSVDGYMDLSFRYYIRNSFELAIQAASKALELDPTADEAYNNICSAYIRLQNWDQAIAAGEKAVTINPRNQRAINNLAQARSEAEQAKQQLPEPPRSPRETTDELRRAEPRPAERNNEDLKAPLQFR